MNKFDFIVIGGGICGFEIGALLSRHGKVLLLEKSSKIGGRARVIKKDGFLLDYGPHPVRFGPKSALGQTCEDAGFSVDFIKPGLMYAFMADGKQHIFPSGSPAAILKTKMVSKLKLAKLLLRVKRYSEEELKDLYTMSLQEFYEEQNIDPGIQQYLNMVSASMMVNPFPEKSSIGALFENVLEVLRKGSVYYPRGGWTSFFEGFQKTIEDNGGEIRVGTEVSKILVKDGKAVGVETKDGPIEAGCIVNTIPIQHLFTILDKNLVDPEFAELCETLAPTAGVSIDFALKKPISDIDGIFFFEDPPGFGFIPTNLSPDIAPEGKSLISVFAPTDVEVIEKKETARALRDKLRAATIQAFPTIEDNLLFEHVLFFPMVDGVQITTKQHPDYRPRYQTAPVIDNLFLTGDSTGGEGAGGDIGHTSVRGCFELIKQTHDL